VTRLLAISAHTRGISNISPTNLKSRPQSDITGQAILNRRAHPPGNRAHGAEDQNRSFLISWAVKQENFQPQGTFFLLTSTFIEQTGH